MKVNTNEDEPCLYKRGVRNRRKQRKTKDISPGALIQWVLIWHRGVEARVIVPDQIVAACNFESRSKATAQGGMRVVGSCVDASPEVSACEKIMGTYSHSNFDALASNAQGVQLVHTLRPDKLS
jgi:hypothetical protein